MAPPRVTAISACRDGGEERGDGDERKGVGNRYHDGH